MNTEERRGDGFGRSAVTLIFPGQMPPLCSFLSAQAVKIPNGISTDDRTIPHREW